MAANPPFRIKADRIIEPLWTRNFNLLVLSNLLMWVGSYFVTTTLPARVISMGGTVADTGIIAGASTFASLLVRPLSGHSLTTHHRRSVLLLGTLIIGVAYIAYPLVALFPLLVLVRILHGSGFSYFSTASSTMIADITPNSRLSEGIGFVGLANTVASSFAPALILILVQINEQLLLAGLVVTSLTSIGFGLLINYEKKSGHLTTPADYEPLSPENGAKKASGFFEPTALRSSAVLFFAIIPIASIMIFIPLYGVERKIDQIGLFYTIIAAATVATRLLIGRHTDRIGTRRLLIPSLGLSALASLILAIAWNPWLILIAAILLGMGTSSLFPVLNAAMIRLSKPDRLGAAHATFFAILDGGVGLGNITLGYVSKYSGFFGFFMATIGFYVISAILYYTILDKPLQAVETT